MISTDSIITLSNGTTKLAKDVTVKDKILTYDFYNKKVCIDFINVIEDDLNEDNKIYEIKFINNIGVEHTLNLKGDVLFNVDTFKWKFDERVPKNFCGVNFMRSAEVIRDLEGHQCKVISVKEVEILKDEMKFIKIIPKFNKCIFVNNMSISCFLPKPYVGR